ncbi:hypothetical protein BT67DRAFT_383101 [Trichocladium antarcticum]|uniref:C3H1-type domain-containing protein n=1 Tax=Trichocladium antarcticum TaxID=1450529 RepID=A0AAN6UHT0_9PEZI|nr:hypothetical protein BT67DRAFT_383101 [Trichocladium antarcticum]
MDAATNGLADFVHRYQSLAAHRDSQESLIKDLIVYLESIESSLRTENASLVGRVRDLELDLIDATRSRRELQQQLQQLEVHAVQRETVIHDNQYLKTNNPYVIFKEDFIKQGVEGGKKAAYALRSAILGECGVHASGLEVIAKVYANLAGLCRAMRRDGCLDSETRLKDFTLGFTQAKASFDFVDVGHGKERADNKVKETTKWHLNNSNCKQVILGISHDAGYAPFLDELFQDPPVRVRVTVLEGIPTVRELSSTGVNILNLNHNLFRSEKLVGRALLDSSVESVVSEAGPRTASVTSGSTSTPATSAASTPAPAPATTYARVIKNGTPPPVLTFPIQAKPASSGRQQPAPKPAPKPGPRGLDPLLQVSPAALDRIKKRKDHNKLCNNHYLRGPCSKGTACMFEHRYQPTKDELAAIALLTRLNPCSNGQACEVEDCIYGHHCPSVRDGVCTHPFCKFGRDDHPPETRVRASKA